MKYFMSMTAEVAQENLLKNMKSMKLEPRRPEIVKSKRSIQNIAKMFNIYLIWLVLT